MRTAPGIRAKLRLLTIVFVVIAAWATPLTLLASDYSRAQFNRFIVVFDPNDGAFPDTETRDGVRFVLIEDPTLTDFPPHPVRDGYVFNGWQLPGGTRLETDYLEVSEDMGLIAIWIRYGEQPTITPGPTPAGPTPTPAPTTTPASTPTPTPQDAQRPNPGTNPIAISFMIFGAVLALGIATFGIVKLATRHALASGQYRIDAARYERESRLEKMLDDTE